MALLLNYNAGVVTPVSDGVQIPVPQSPGGVGIAQVNITVPRAGTIVQINATIGVRGNAGTGSLLFRVFRDGQEVYYTRQGIESGFEQFYTITLQAFDGGAPAGLHGYQLSVEKLTPGLSATVIGPLNMSVSVYG